MYTPAERSKPADRPSIQTRVIERHELKTLQFGDVNPAPPSHSFSLASGQSIKECPTLNRWQFINPRQKLTSQTCRHLTTPPSNRQLPHNRRHRCGITHTAILPATLRLMLTISSKLSIGFDHGPCEGLQVVRSGV
jgi:hypothetical protein